MYTGVVRPRSTLEQGFRSFASSEPNGQEAWGQFGELDASYAFGNLGYLRAEAGHILVYNISPDSKGSLTCYLVEPLYNITDQLYAVARYSVIGTFSDTFGYPLSDGMTGDGGGTVNGARKFDRWAVGAGYRLNPSAALKLEYSRDRFETIASAAPVGNNREFFGFQAVVKF
jgi:hypothetical protein